jgi:hypothetical protein
MSVGSDTGCVTMTKLKFFAGSAVALALVATSISPAFARGGWGGGWRHHRHHDRIDAGDVITGIFIIGAIAAISGGSKKSRSERASRSERDSRRDDSDDPRAEDRSKISSEDDAVQACATAAEDRAGPASSVRRIDTVRSEGDGWTVAGVIERRDSWRDRSAQERSFSCTVQFGRVESINIASGAEA